MRGQYCIIRSSLAVGEALWTNCVVSTMREKIEKMNLRALRLNYVSGFNQHVIKQTEYNFSSGAVLTVLSVLTNYGEAKLFAVAPVVFLHFS